MKVLSTIGLTKLIQLIKGSFLSIDDTVDADEVDVEQITEMETDEVTAIDLKTINGSSLVGTGNIETVVSVNNISPVNGNITLSIPTVTDTYSSTSSDGMSGKAVASALGSYVPMTRKVNNKALSSDITLSASDVGAAATSHNQAANTINAMTGYNKSAGTATGIVATDTLNVALAKIEQVLDTKQGGGSYVPTSRKINNKDLSSDITLTASDVGALPSSTVIPTITDTYSATSSNGMSGKAVASAISNKADKATSLSGYGITDAYTKTEIDGKLSAAMHFKGTKASVSNLPTTGNVQGDMWNVTDTGANYAWDGSQWDKLSENIDLSGYVPTSRTINNKALTGNISLTASDVGALPSSTSIPTITDTYSATSSDGMSGKAVASAVSSKVTSNTAITGATKCKITYDSKGLVTAGADLAASDIPNLASNKTTAMTGYSKASASAAISTSDSLNTAIGKLEYKADNAVIANSSITGATKCKITYDSKGLVTDGADLQASDIPSLTLSKISDVTATATELNVLDGITATTTELNYTDGVTSNIQTQLNAKAADSDVVKLTGDQSISGTKTFTDTIKSTKQGQGIFLTRKSKEDSSGTGFVDLQFIDTQDKRKGGVRNIIENGNTTCMYVTNEAGNQIKSSINITYNEDNNTVTTSAPTPSTSDNSTQIATTAYVKSNLSSKQDTLVSGTNIKTINNTSLLGSGNINALTDDSFDVVHTVIETYQNGADWYRIYDDGWVEQGGNFGAAYTSYTQKTFTFLKPFLNIDYFVTCHSAHTGDLYYPSIVSKTPTTVTFYGTYNNGGYGDWYACGYGA